MRAGREGGGPTPAEIERVRTGVQAKLAAGTALSLSLAAPRLALAVKIGAVSVVLGGAVTTAILVRSPVPPTRPAFVAVPQPTRAAAPAREVPAQALPAPLPPSSQSATGDTSLRRTRRALQRPAPPDLAGEVALLREAKGAVERKDEARAQSLLAEYDRRFHPALLAEERMATAVVLSCLGSSPDSSEKALLAFKARYPRSPLLAKVESSCPRPTAPR